ncbi:MAG: hypothetical protein WC635_03185 [Bacteriovorax sp.]|jgi:hypothetical protein
MKKIIAAMSFVLASQSVFADGFVCENSDMGLKVKAFNNTQPVAGTRNAAVMIVSDTTVAYENKTIAKFEAETKLLKNKGASYTAKVDLRFTNSSRKGELIGGTKLGQLASMDLDVLFSYASPIADGQVVPGYLTLNKRNGDMSVIEMDCARYLKN